MASVNKELQSIYQPQSEYHRTVGSKEKFETRLFCDNPNNLNPATRQLTVTQTLSSGYVYDLSEAYVWMIVQLWNTTGNAAFAAGVNMSVNVDAFFSEVNIQIANTDINGGYGSKKYCHKGAHLKKLIELDPEEARAIRDKELFYPDSSNATAAEITPYSLYGSAATIAAANVLAGGVGTTSTTVLAIGGAGAGAAGIQASGTGAELLTAGFCQITKNKNYNAGHDARRIKLDDGQKYAVCVPLKYYAPSLATLKDGLTNVPIKFTFQKPIASECVQTVNAHVATVGDYVIVPSGFEVRIPTYLPDSERMVALTGKISRGIKEVKKYVDLDIYQSSTTFPSLATNTVNTWVNAVDRRPVGAMIAFQYVGDYQVQNGNTHRYFCPNIKTAQIQLGSGQLFPKNQVQLLGTTNTALGARPIAPYSEEQVTINSGFTTDQTQLYLDFLRFTGADQSKAGSIIDMEMFLKHKFFLTFDMRDIDEQYFSIGNALNLKLDCTHEAVQSAANTQTYYAGAAANTVGGLPGGDYKVWLFLFTERALEVTQNSAGVSVRSNIDDPY